MPSGTTISTTLFAWRSRASRRVITRTSTGWKIWRFLFEMNTSQDVIQNTGKKATAIPPLTFRGEKLVIFSQNHDQVGNRKVGDRLSASASFKQLKLAAASVLLSLFVPLLFMGEEYGETAPFQYFVSHGDAALIEAVRKGRQEEFSRFEWQGELPDPQDEETFRRSKINWELSTTGKHQILKNYYRELLRLRRKISALASLDKKRQKVTVLKEQRTFWVHRWADGSRAIALFHFGDGRAQVEMDFPDGSWIRLLNSAEERWSGPERKAEGMAEYSGAVKLQIEPWSALLFVCSSSPK